MISSSLQVDTTKSLVFKTNPTYPRPKRLLCLSSCCTIYMEQPLFCSGVSILSKPMMHFAYFPYFSNIYKFPRPFSLLFVFGFPYFDHDAFTHHALHVLDFLLLIGIFS